MKVANEGLGPQQEIQNFLTRVLNLQMHHRFQVGIKIHTLIDNSHTKLASHFSLTQILQLKPSSYTTAKRLQLKFGLVAESDLKVHVERELVSQTEKKDMKAFLGR